MSSLNRGMMPFAIQRGSFLIASMHLSLILSKCSIPDTWNQEVALRTVPICRRKSVFDHVEAVAPDHSFAAFRAIGVLPFANHARQVARVNKVQTGLRADLRRAD